MTVTSEELSPAIYNSIKVYSAKGDQLAAAKSYEEAISEYNKAWDLVPDPKNQWNASTWILAAIADAAFLGGYKTSAREALQYAMTCPDAVGNPFLHLRYGEVLLDAGEEDAAAEELMRAYMAEGDEIFSTEDPHYFEFLKTRVKL
jgi:tetratricopeptide (TPR) repeat protein